MNNFAKIREAVCKSDLDAMLIWGESDRLYATGFAASDGMAIVTKKNAYFFTDSRYIEAAQMSISDAEVAMVDRNRNYFACVNKVIEDEGLNTVGIEEDDLRYSDYLSFSEKIKAKLVPSQSLMRTLREVKSSEELDTLIKVQRIAEKSLEEVIPLISTDVTEKAIAAELLYRMLKNGADDKSFDPIVVSAEKSSMPHGVPGDVLIKKGFLTIDFGAKLDGYCSDMTRTFCLGKPTDEMINVYDTVLKAQLAGIAAAKAGIPGKDVDGAARKVIENAGYGEYFGHSFGHGVGIDIHEYPNASPSNDKPLPVGAVISAEPGIYLPGKFGVRIEDVLYVTENGCVDITKTDKKLIIL